MKKQPLAATKARVFQRAGSSNWQACFTLPDGSKHYRTTASPDEPSQPPPLLTFDLVAQRFFAMHKMADATRRGYRASFERWKKTLSGIDITHISRDHLANFVQTRLRAGTGTPAIRQDLAFLSSLLTSSQLLPGGPERNVARDYPRRHLAPPNQREKFLTQDEAESVLYLLDDVRKAIVRCALETGMRRGEVLCLRKSEVDLTSRFIRLSKQRTKTHTARSVPISPKLFSVLEQRLRTPTEWVFANPETGMPFYDANPWFPKAVAEAGLVGTRFHDLRHTFASWWVQRGGKLRTLQEILGHTSAQTTKRYAHLRPDHVADEFHQIWK